MSSRSDRSFCLRPVLFPAGRSSFPSLACSGRGSGTERRITSRSGRIPPQVSQQVVTLLAAGLALLSPPAVALGGDSSAGTSPSIPADEVQAGALLRVAGSEFGIHRTPHFLVAFNTPPGLARSLSARLEQTYDSVSRFCRLSGFPGRPLDRRLEVIFFNDFPEYARYARRTRFDAHGTYGFYYDGTNRSAFFNVHNDPQLRDLHADIRAARDNIDRMEETVRSIRANQAFVEIIYSGGRRVRLTPDQARREVEDARKELKTLDARQQSYCERITRTVVQHEVAHQILYNTGVHVRAAANPKWLVEGLACMFETPPGAGGSGLSAINQARLKDFRDAVAGEDGPRLLTPAKYTAAVQEGRMTRLQDLLRKPELFEQRGQEGATHYAAAWGLLHYLHRTRNSSLAGYLQEVAARKPGTVLGPDEEMKLFEKHFGPVDDDFAARMAAYILCLPCRASPDLD